jgi:hypothetical protein
MVTSPPDTPVTTPDVLPIVAIAVLSLVHIPPLMVFTKPAVVPTHNDVLPNIVPGSGSTVITKAAGIPQLVKNEIVAVPAATPVTRPVVKPTLATLVLLLIQKPLPAVLVRVVVDPRQTVELPDVVPGIGDIAMLRVAPAPQPLL